MITAQTVLVLGAGASHPYGFPVGEALVKQICDEIEKKKAVFMALASLTRKESTILNFGYALREAGRYSIDAFLESSLGHKYLEIGKNAIAAALVPCENEANLNPARKDGWYRYTFDQLLNGSRLDPLAAFKTSASNLKVITFNFDRSFERALFRFVQANLARDLEQAAELTRRVLVAHVHGDLGVSTWLSRETCGRDYSAPSALALTEEVKLCAGRIRLVTEEIPDSVLSTIRGWIENAKNIGFIGFAYDHRNLVRLGKDDLLDRNRQQITGTSYGLTSGHQSRARQTIGGLVLHDLMAHKFVEQWMPLHGTD